MQGELVTGTTHIFGGNRDVLVRALAISTRSRDKVSQSGGLTFAALSARFGRDWRLCDWQKTVTFDTSEIPIPEVIRGSPMTHGVFSWGYGYANNGVRRPSTKSQIRIRTSQNGTSMAPRPAKLRVTTPMSSSDQWRCSRIRSVVVTMC